MAKPFALINTEVINCGGNSNNNSNSDSDLPEKGKMVRKRAASEIELHAGAGGEFQRLLRRTSAANLLLPLGGGGGGGHDFAVCGGSGNQGNSNNNNNNNGTVVMNNNANMMMANYSTTTIALPSSTNLSVVTSGGSAAGSSSDSAFSTTNQTSYMVEPPLFHHPHLITTTHHRQGLQAQTPSVCVFSGLPLFPPEKNRSTAGPLISASASISPLSTSNAGGLNGGGALPTTMEDSSATAWIDSFIKDLIHSSTNISIPQLVQNVREIIYPCNPNLAAVVEYRLRSLSGVDSVSNYSDRRRKEGLGGQDHVHLQGPGQVQVGSSSSGSKLYLDDNLLPPPPPPPHAFSETPNQYVNWGFAPPKATSIISADNSQQIRNNNNSNNNNNNTISGGLSFVTPALPSSTGQLEQSSQPETQPRPSEQQRNESPPALPPDDAAADRLVPPSTSAPLMANIAAKKDEIRQQKRDEDGLHLLTLLLQCAEAVAADNLEEANNMLLEISELSTPFGSSAQRVAAYFSEAMSARLVSSCLGIYAALPTVPHSQKMASAFQVFNGISPFIKFSHFTANQAIQEAFEREERVHIIDLDIMQGLQWPGLFHILASRPGGPPFVRLTGLGTSIEALEATGKRLTDFAEKLGLPFEFNPVPDRVGNLDLDKLNVSKREAVAVHWLQHSLYDVTGSDTNTLWLLQRYSAVT